MTVIDGDWIQCDNCEKKVGTIAADLYEDAMTGWGSYNWDGSARKPTDELLDKPSLDLCADCNTQEILDRLVWGEEDA